MFFRFFPSRLRRSCLLIRVVFSFPPLPKLILLLGSGPVHRGPVLIHELRTAVGAYCEEDAEYHQPEEQYLAQVQRKILAHKKCEAAECDREAGGREHQRFVNADGALRFAGWDGILGGEARDYGDDCREGAEIEQA